MSFLFIIFAVLVLLACGTLQFVGLTLATVLFYQFITRSKVTKHQITRIFITMVSIWVIGVVIAVASGASFDTVPGERVMGSGEVALLILGLFCFHVLAGCITARLSQSKK